MERGRIESLKRNLIRPYADIDNMPSQIRELAEYCPEEMIKYFLNNISNGIIPSPPVLIELVLSLRDRELYLVSKKYILKNDIDKAIRLLEAEFPDPEIEELLINELPKYIDDFNPWRRFIVTALMNHGSINCLGALQAIEFEFDPKQKRSEVLIVATKNSIIDGTSAHASNFDFVPKMTRLEAQSTFGQLLKKAVKTISERNLLPKDDWVITPPPIDQSTNTKSITELIAQGENVFCEFKSTLRWDMREKKLNLILQQEVIEAIAAFSNHLGGTLLIGIDDNGNAIGLQFDYESFKDSKNRDQLQRHIQDLIKDEINTPFSISNIQINFQKLEDKDICRIDILRSNSPIFLKSQDKSGKPTEKFVVRNGNSSRALSPSEQASYIQEHFG